jgi:copper chaperone CopZ
MHLHLRNLFTYPITRMTGKPERSVDTTLVRLRVDGMLCPLCADRVQRALSRPAGVLSAAVDFETGTAEVVYRGGGNEEPDWDEEVQRMVVLKPVRRVLDFLGRFRKRGLRSSQ